MKTRSTPFKRFNFLEQPIEGDRKEYLIRLLWMYKQFYSQNNCPLLLNLIDKTKKELNNIYEQR